MMAMRCTIPPKDAAATAARGHRASIPVIDTERLRLRPPSLEDLPAWTEIYREEGPFLGGATTPEDAWTEFSYYTACWMLHGHGLWSVETRATGTLVGFVHIGIEWEDEEPELGYLFTAAARGQGYATEAATAARDWGLRLLPEFVSYVNRDNTASNRLAERMGATRDLAAEANITAAEGDSPHVWRHGRTT
ncbi:MAG: GNAT family N-acetyltransferase [Pseudomonadota bacterium]